MICNDIVETSTGTRNDLYVPSRLCSIVPHDSTFRHVLISKGGIIIIFIIIVVVTIVVQDESKNELLLFVNIILPFL